MSRTCPSCSATYGAGTFFCGVDGTIIIEDQDASDFDNRLGRQLGGYIVAARVADGAMGRVFEGRHPETKERVAIKVLHADVAKDSIAVERFKREYETALEMDHENVIKVLEFGDTEDGSHFMTMEFLHGIELGQALGKGTVQTPARIVRVICQMALALDFAHSFGFIHRDLKPDNIFLCKTPDGDSVRILDFGSVKLQLEMGAKLTAVGTTLGSPYYMSPEQATGAADVDQRTDVFALAAILYEMLTDKVAFDGPNVAMILMKIMNESPPPPSAINPDCPASVDDIVDKGVRKDKTRRYETAGALATALVAAYGLDGTIEKWAKAPESEIAVALAATAPAAAKPFGESLPPKGATPAAGVVPPAAGAQAAPRPAQRPSADRLSAAGDDYALPGVNSGMGKVVGLVVAAAVVGGMVLYLMR